jgi:DNA polymerase III sliding clamp (beta) subunit (PCNA family)
MKATLPLAQIQADLKAAAKFAATDSVKPILTCAFLEVSKESYCLETTNSEMGIVLIGKVVKCEEPGQCLLPADRAAAATALMSGEYVDIDNLEKGHITLLCGNDEYQFPKQDPKAFHRLPQPSGSDYTEIPAGSLGTALKRTVIPIKGEDIVMPKSRVQYAASGALITVGDDSRVVITDSRMLGTGAFETKKVGNPKTISPCILPPQFCAAAERVFSKAEGDSVQAYFDQNFACFRIGEHTILHTLLMQGSYPPWRAIMANRKFFNVSVQWESLAEAIKKAMLVCDDINRGVHFSFEKERISVFASSDGIGYSRAEVAAACEREVEVILSTVILKPLIRAIPGNPTVTLEVTDERCALVVQDGNFTYALMPLMK